MILSLVLANQLFWHLNPEPDIVTYKVHWRTSDPSALQLTPYLFSMDVGNTNHAILPMIKNVWYSVAITAINDCGEESDYSNKIVIINVP